MFYMKDFSTDELLTLLEILCSRYPVEDINFVAGSIKFIEPSKGSDLLKLFFRVSSELVNRIGSDNL